MKIGSTLFILLMIVACNDVSTSKDAAQAPDIGELVREYLFLELAMGSIDSNHVDAYFGPDDIKTEAAAANLSLGEIRDQANTLSTKLAALTPDSDLERQRVAGLQARLLALDTRIDINNEHYVSFDEESKALFGTTAPTYDATHFDAILDEIEAIVPGDGPLASRVDAFQLEFAIPPDRLAAVFEAAIAECRRRTLQNIELDDGESFTIEYVTDKPWSGYNWYQGNSVSLIQVNTDLPIFIHRAVDFGCHEGYPGHHTFNALLEQNLVNDKGWLEYTLYPLFSPESVIAEGSGNYGITLAFPGDERSQFEKDVLFPLAGLDVGRADDYYRLFDLKQQLDFAGNEAARGYLNGEMTREQAVDWLMKYTLTSRARAEQRTRFYDTYRSYVINYNHGKRLVADYVERGDADNDERWRRFEAILSAPALPIDLEN